MLDMLQVLVIVPPSRKVQFIFLCDKRPSSVLPWMRQLRELAGSSPCAKSDLMRLTEIVLHRSYSCSKDWEGCDNIIELKQEAAIVALQNGRLDLYDNAVHKTSGPMPPEVYQTLGSLMAPKEDESIKAR